MATYGGTDFTNFRNVRVRGDSNNSSGSVRFATSVGGFEGTLSMNASSSYTEASQNWLLPNKSGLMVVGGTFSVDIPAISGFTETAVTVSGIRREDLLSVTIRDMISTVTTGRAFPYIAGARPENGYIYMTLATPGTATIWGSAVCSYVAAR